MTIHIIGIIYSTYRLIKEIYNIKPHVERLEGSRKKLKDTVHDACKVVFSYHLFLCIIIQVFLLYAHRLHFHFFIIKLMFVTRLLNVLASFRTSSGLYVVHTY